MQIWVGYPSWWSLERMDGNDIIFRQRSQIMQRACLEEIVQEAGDDGVGRNFVWGRAIINLLQKLTKTAANYYLIRNTIESKKFIVRWLMIYSTVYDILK
jgi:hypothetical protein